MSAAMAQRMNALERANVIRLDGAQLKREIRAGTTPISAALRDERAQSMRICALLEAQWKWGEQRTRRYLGTHFIHPHKRVRDLTERQKTVISEELS